MAKKNDAVGQNVKPRGKMSAYAFFLQVSKFLHGYPGEKKKIAHTLRKSGLSEKYFCGWKAAMMWTWKPQSGLANFPPSFLPSQVYRSELKQRNPNESVNFAEFSKRCAEKWKVCWKN